MEGDTCDSSRSNSVSQFQNMCMVWIEHNCILLSRALMILGLLSCLVVDHFGAVFKCVSLNLKHGKVCYPRIIRMWHSKRCITMTSLQPPLQICMRESTSCLLIQVSHLILPFSVKSVTSHLNWIKCVYSCLPSWCEKRCKDQKNSYNWCCETWHHNRGSVWISSM